MVATKRNPRSVGADRGRALQVDCLLGRANYTKLREAAQPHADMGYSLEIYKTRSQVDDWFSVYGLVVLTKAEYFVLRFIVARTVNYGKTSEIIFKAHFLEGVQAGGEWKTAPCGVNSRDLYAAIASLEGKGIIRTSRMENGKKHLATIYTINIETLISLREKPKMALKLPKRLRESVVPNGTTTPEVERCQMAPKNSYKDKDEDFDGVRARARVRRTRKPEVEIDCNLAGKEKIEAIAKAVASRTATKQLEKVRRGRAAAPGAITLTDLNATWKRCMVNTFGTCSVVGLTHKEYGIFKKVIKTHELDFTWEEFFTWSISAWGTINADHRERSEYAKRRSSGWSMKTGEAHYLTTTTPMLSSLVKNFNKLLRMYVERDTRVKVQSADVEELQDRLEKAERAAKTAQAQVSRLSRLREAVPLTQTVKKKAQKVTIIARPEDDDFFEGEDDLPEWREA